MGLTSEQSDSENEREVVEHPNGEYFTMQRPVSYLWIDVHRGTRK